MHIGFQFLVINNDDGLFNFRISAWNGAFGGTTDVYVWAETLQEIAAKLKGFPQHLSDSDEILWGTFEPNYAGGGVSMRFYCANSAGHLRVDAKIESEKLTNTLTQSVTLSLPIEASAIDAFVEALQAISVKGSGMAELNGFAF